MKILVFGAHGRVGEMLCRAARAAGHELITPTHAECDLEYPAAVGELVLRSEAELVVNRAAVSRVEECEDDALRAHLVNAMSPATMALACRHTGARFIHLSTDYVLDGRRPGLKSADARCKPVNTYGFSKMEAELQVREGNAEALILRVSWVCGNPRKPSFVENAVAQAVRGEKLVAAVDQDSMPTHAGDIARAILSPQLEGVSGVLQVTSSGEPMSRYSGTMVALEHARSVGALSQMPVVEPQKICDMGRFRAPRPAHTAMDNCDLLALGIPMPSARESICRAVDDYLSYTAGQTH